MQSRRLKEMNNDYISYSSTIVDLCKHTKMEWTFTMTVQDSSIVKPGQFFEISIPKYGEAPISVSGIGDNTVDFTIRNVGKVTSEIFKLDKGDSLLIRGPYGNGFDVTEYEGKEILLVAGGTGLSPVRGVVDYFAKHPEKCKSFTLICGFKSPEDVLFKADIERWKETIHVVQTVDRAPDGYEGPVGMVTKFIPDVKFEDVSNAVAIVVGPPIMMKFVVIEFTKLGIQEEQIWTSQERKMCCGLGKCGHCRIDDTYVCLDGPVFPYVVAKNLID